MAKEVKIALILAILLCLSSTSITALASIPDVGPSGCVPAPGLPCGTDTGSSGGNTQKTTSTKTTTPQTGGYTATKADERTTEEEIPEKVEISIKNHQDPTAGYYYDVYVGEEPLDKACPTLETVDCWKKCGPQNNECFSPCLDVQQKKIDAWTACYNAWSKKHGQLIDAYYAQHKCGDAYCLDDEETIEVPSDLKDSVADNNKVEQSELDRLGLAVNALMNKALSEGETRDFSKNLAMLNKAAKSKQMSDADLEKFIGYLQKYLAQRIPRMTLQDEVGTIASALTSLSVAMNEAKARGNTQLINRLSSDFEKDINDVIMIIEKNKLEKGQKLTKEQIEWADDVIDGMKQGIKEMKFFGQKENAAKAEKLSNDLRDALKSSTDNKLDATAAQLDLRQSKDMTVTEEMERAEQNKKTSNKKMVEQKLDLARAKVQEMLEAKYRKPMTQDEFAQKNKDYQESRDDVVNLFIDVLEQEPSNQEANFALATIYRKENRKSDAAVFYERAILGADKNTQQIFIKGIRDDELRQQVLQDIGLKAPPSKANKVMNALYESVTSENPDAPPAQASTIFDITRLSKGFSILSEDYFKKPYKTVKGLFTEEGENKNVNEAADDKNP